WLIELAFDITTARVLSLTKRALGMPSVVRASRLKCNSDPYRCCVVRPPSPPPPPPPDENPPDDTLPPPLDDEPLDEPPPRDAPEDAPPRLACDSVSRGLICVYPTPLMRRPDPVECADADEPPPPSAIPV